jgi:hypothetical protein
MTIVRFPPPAINPRQEAMAAPLSRPPQAAPAFGAFLASAARKAGSPPGDGSPLSRVQRPELIAEIRTRMNNCWLGVPGDGEKRGRIVK